MRVDTGLADEGMIGHNFEAHMADLQKRMLDAAGNLEFEEAARLRDEIKRLRETELVLADDPLARQEDVEARAGAFSRGRQAGSTGLACAQADSRRDGRARRSASRNFGPPARPGRPFDRAALPARTPLTR